MTSMPSTPRDLIPAHEAAKVALCSTSTLKRRAARGEITRFERPGYKSPFYSRAQVERLRPKAVPA
jgi:hypothetical protein